VSHPPFALLYDYRCPFARNVHEHVLAARAAGLELDVRFEPFILNQGHVPDGGPSVWDDPRHDGDLLSLEVSVAVRDEIPASFDALHQLLFEARHRRGISLTTREQLAELLEEVDLDPGEVFALVDSRGPRRLIAEAWRHYHDDLDVFGVPTFVFGDEDATFVRLMIGPDPEDEGASIAVVERLLHLVCHQTEINELKHTRVPQ
jgi:hypothetical protein